MPPRSKLTKLPGSLLATMLQPDNVTRLNLLTREGALSVEFTPALDSAQYEELHTIVDEFDSIDVAKALISDAAKRWDRKVEF